MKLQNFFSWPFCPRQDSPRRTDPPLAENFSALGEIRTPNVCFEGKYDIRFTTRAGWFNSIIKFEKRQCLH